MQRAGWIVFALSVAFRALTALVLEGPLVTRETCGPYVPWKFRLAVIACGIALWAPLAVFAAICLRRSKPEKDWTAYGLLLALLSLFTPLADIFVLAFSIAMC